MPRAKASSVFESVVVMHVVAPLAYILESTPQAPRSTFWLVDEFPLSGCQAAPMLGVGNTVACLPYKERQMAQRGGNMHTNISTHRALPSCVIKIWNTQPASAGSERGPPSFSPGPRISQLPAMTGLKWVSRVALRTRFHPASVLSSIGLWPSFKPKSAMISMKESVSSMSEICSPAAACTSVV